MAEVITMPRLSDTMTEGKVAKWLKKVGDAVSEGDIIAEIETDKAVQDFESEINGTLLYVGVEEGGSSPVDTILAIIGQQGEDISALISGGSSSAPQQQEAVVATNEEYVEVAVEIPAGVEVVNVPRLSDTMTEGKVAKWNFKVGDAVKEGDIIAEIETDKATQDFESEYDGTLLYIGVEEGGSAPVDTILAIIGPAGTDVSAIINGGGQAPKVASKDVSAPAQPVASTANNKDTENGRIAISPLARKMASDKGIDISTIKGTGENGRIVRRDIENCKPAVAPANV